MANPTFTMIGTNSFGLSDIGSEAAPVLVDLDGDGDLDLLVGNADGNTVFFRNNGTTLSPAFTLDSTNPFGIINVSAGGALPGLADIDGDGDLDLFIGNHAGTTLFFRNNGTAQAPTFSLEGTGLFGIQNAGSYGAPSFADLDCDGDLDLLIGNANGNILLYRNNGSTQAPTFSLEATNPFGLAGDLDGYASPALADINGDGLVDLITKSNVYVNVGTAAAPTFSLFATNPYGNPGPGAYPRPALGDLDGDGDRDLVIGVDGGDLEYFRNVAPVIVALGDGGNTIALSQINTLTGGAGTDLVSLVDIGATFLVTGVETLTGSSATDLVMLGGGGNTLLVRRIETLTGGIGTDVVTLGSLGNTMLVGGVETLAGGIGTDVVTLGSLGNTMQVDGVETLTGGTGTDVVTLGNSAGNLLTVFRLETLTGGAGTDVVTFASGGNTLLAVGIETLTGAVGVDLVTLGSGGNTLTVRLLESLIGGTGTDIVTLGSGGNTLTVRLLESLIGGTGTDIVTLSSGGNTVWVTGVESLVGSSGADAVTLDGNGNTLTVRLVETLFGGSGTDIVTFGSGGNTVWVTGVESLVGGTGTDMVRLDSDGNTLTVRLIETLTGGSGSDAVTLGTGGNTLRVSGIETATGGSGTDVVMLLTGGNTLTVSLLESLIGANGTDVVTLGSTGNTILVSALETLFGGSGTDVVTISASGVTVLVSGIETLSGNSGVEIVTLGDSAGNTLTASRLETVFGGAGTDVVTFGGTFGSTTLVTGVETLTGGSAIDIVTLGSGGNTIEVSRIETLLGGSGNDVVTLGSGGNTLLVRLLETLTGGSGTDVLTLGTGSNVMTVNGVETINGGSGLDIVTLGDSAGNTLTVWRLETLIGNSGTDVVTLGSAGVTLLVDGVETVTGGLGTDMVELGSAGNTLLLGGIETLAGGIGTDVVTLGGGGNTLLVSSIETLAGSAGTDVVTLGDSTGNTLRVSEVETLIGGSGTDVVTFSPFGNQGTLFVSGVETVYTPFQTLTLNGVDTLIVLPTSPSTPALSPASDSGVIGDAVTNASQPTLTGTADAGSVLHLYGNGVEIGTGTVNGSGAWSMVPGTTLADGDWTLTAKVTVSGVESGESGPLLVTIDTGASAPTSLALATSSNSGSTADTLTNVTAPVIAGTVGEAGVVVLYEGATALGTVTAAAAGAWSITAASLSNGAHTLSATVIDAAGNTSSASTALTVTIDTGANAPSGLALTGGSNSGSTADTLTNVTAPVIAGTVGEAGVVVLYEGATALGTVTAAAAGAWSITAASLSDGAHTLSATVTDAAGNTSSASTALTVTIDTGASSPTGLALAAASNSGSTADTLTNVTAPVIAGTVGEAGVVVLYEGATALGTVTAAAAGAWSITAASLSNGAHTLSATVTDAAGNTSSASTALTVTIDTGASSPTGLALAAASNSGSTADTLTNVSAPVITGSVAEAGVVVLYEGATALGTVTAAAAGAWSITAASLSDGVHTLSATVTDAAGNTSSASTALTVTIDTGAPSVAIALDKTTLGVGETATVTFTFSEAPVGFSLSAVSAQNGTLSNLSILLGSDGLVYTATLTPSVETVASDSRITIATSWSDIAGNTPLPTASAGYTIDTRSPPGNTAPLIGGAVAGQAVDDTASRQPFTTMTVSDNQTAQAQTVVVTVRNSGGTVGDATGAFTAASLSASGFAKSAAGTYALTANSAAVAQAALRLLDFQPVANRAAPGFQETTVFTVTVTDADGASATNSTTSVNVLSVNDAPVLAHALGTRSVEQGQSFSFTVPAGAFTDADASDSLTFSATSGDGLALPGWLSFDSATGRLSGTPGNADVGTRTVRVTATDTSGVTVSDLLTIQVANVNDAPVAANDAGDTDRLTPVTVVAASGVLANDTDPDVGDHLVVSAVNGDAANVGRAITLAGGGRLILNADGGYSFDPAGGYGTLLFGQTRQETVSYTVADQAGATSTATLTITVRGVNTAPAVQEAKHVAIDQNSSRVGLSIDKPVDPEGDPLTITVTGLPTVGTLQRYDGTALSIGDTLTPDQLAAVIYTPPFGATGAAGSFSYAVSDGTNLVGRAVTISLTPVQWLSLTPSSLSIAESNSGSTSLTYTITRRGDSSGATTVKWQVDTIGLSGSLADAADAADAADFGGTLPSGTVTFAAGETSKTITIPISGDRQVEGNEQFRVLLFSPSTTVADAKITVENATATGTILNDDRAATVTAVTGPAAGRYLAARGDTLDFTVAFSDTVGVSGTGTPRLTLTIGTQTRYATFLRVESGKLVFRYAVGAGDLDNDGIAVAGSIDLNGAQILDSAGNAVTSLGFGSAAPVTSHVLVNVRGGHAIDGYIAGATVFADANANGQLDEGEAFGTTNAVGSWSISGGSGPIVMIGGTDISTNLPFTGVYEAPGSASVITPLTTIVMGMAGLAGTEIAIAAAATELKSKLGLDAGLDLLSYDPIVAVTTTGADAAAIATALKTQAAAASVANVIVQGSAVLAGVVIGTPRASGVIGRALVSAIADAVKAFPAGGTIDLADPAVLAAILAAAGARIGAVDSAKLAAVTNGAANVIAASNGAVITAGTTNSGGIDGLTQMAQAQVVAQGTAADELRSGTTVGDVSGAVTAFTGTNLQQQISAAQVAVVVPSRLAIAATDADRREGNSGTTAFTFTVTRAGNTSGSLTVAWAVAAGSGTAGATPDAADFGGTMPSGTVSFADGEATKTITILVSGDTDIEPDETFTVTLSNPSVTATAIETASASGIIRNEDPIDPQLTLPATRTVVVGTATAIAGLSVMDGDSATVTVTLMPGNGSLGLAGPAAVSTDGDGTVTVSGSVADVNTTLASLVFTGSGGQTAGSIAVTVADGDPSTPDASGTLAIAIQSAPANVLPSSPTLVAGRSTEVLGLEITDIDGGTMTVVLTPTNGALTLPLYGSATTSDLGNGKVRLTGSLEDVNRTLQQLEFTASRNVISASIRFESSDDQPLTPDADSLLVIGVLSSPEHTAPTALSVISGVATAVTGLSVSDYDSPTLQVTLTPTNGALALTAQGGVTLTQTSADVWRLLGTQADITATLATLTFTGAAGQTSGTIRVTTSDLGTLTTDAETSIAVTIADPATLVAPTLTLPQPITLDQGLATALTGIQVADPDSPAVTVTLTPSQAILGATAAGQASVATAGDGTLTISGSVADVNATLAALRITGGIAATATVSGTGTDGLPTP
ncbi:Ig-like domain-containing protein, partial [Azospirillum brasilense]|uniref:Ig-like domain-containing protein n=1 Tax=Azospirillum brasilense TaxID=192 RepID=UPI0031F31811